jgi:peptidoglycan hydrolase CwlO-like protein
MESSTNTESCMLHWLKSKYPNKEYPSNTGQKWIDEEEKLLLEELSKNIDIQVIAQKHNRTIGGINSRRRKIAYELYSKNSSIEEIMLKTKLNEETIQKTINNHSKKKSFSTENNIDEKKNDIEEIKNDIKELKNTIKELVEIIKTLNK